MIHAIFVNEWDLVRSRHSKVSHLVRQRAAGEVISVCSRQFMESLGMILRRVNPGDQAAVCEACAGEKRGKKTLKAEPVEIERYDYHRDGVWNPKDRDEESFNDFDFLWPLSIMLDSANRTLVEIELKSNLIRLRDAVKSDKIIYAEYGVCVYHPDRDGWWNTFFRRLHDEWGPNLYPDIFSE